MGYSTDFDGSLEFNEPVTEEFRDYINRFSSTRRMIRDNAKIMELYPDWAEYTLDGELGTQGEYFAYDELVDEFSDKSVKNVNVPPDTQPGLWCQWVISDDCKYLEWDTGEKFYHYKTWLEYLIENFIEPHNYLLNGTIYWQGEESEDSGALIVTDNIVEVVANPNSNCCIAE